MRCGPRIGLDFVPRSPLNVVQIPANANGGRSSLKANQTTSFFLVTGFVSGAYSANYSLAQGSGCLASTTCASVAMKCCGCW
jgi:hypothetical protein